MSLESLELLLGKLKSVMQRSKFNEVPIGTDCNRSDCNNKILIKVKPGTQNSLDSLRLWQEKIDTHNKYFHNSDPKPR